MRSWICSIQTVKKKKDVREKEANQESDRVQTKLGVNLFVRMLISTHVQLLYGRGLFKPESLSTKCFIRFGYVDEKLEEKKKSPVCCTEAHTVTITTTAFYSEFFFFFFFKLHPVTKDILMF